MDAPEFVHQPITSAWPKMVDGFWLVYTEKYPDGIVRRGNRATKKFYGDKLIFLSDDKGRQFYYGYYKNDVEVTGPFSCAREATIYRREEQRMGA